MHSCAAWHRASIPARAALLALAFSCVVSAPRPATAQTKEKQPARQVVKYLAHKEKVPYQGKLVMVLRVEPVAGGRPIELVVKNHDMNKKEYNPVVNTDNVNALQPGEAIKIELDETKPKPFVTYVREYKMKAGEERPGVYVFESSYEKADVRPAYTAVVLSKFDSMTTLAIPQKKNKEGKLEPDADIAAMVGALKTGELVEAEVRESRPVAVLTHIDRYSAPQTGKFLKATEQDVAEGQKGSAVEIEQGGKTVTALVPGKVQNQKWVPDGKLAAAVRKLKADAEVVYRTRQDGDKVWLKEIEPAPKQAEKKEKPTESGAVEGDDRRPRRGARGANR